MSLFKWTLAAAGTVVGMRYMSDRHRRRMADGGRAAQTDRDDGRDAATPWSSAQGSDKSGAGVGTGLGTGLGTELGTPIAGSGTASFERDDPLAPYSDSTLGGSNRF